MRDAGKVALVGLVERLRAGGATLQRSREVRAAASEEEAFLKARTIGISARFQF